MKEEYKIGDRVLVKRRFSLISRNPFHISIKRIGKDIFGEFYYGSYGVNSDFSGHYDTIGKFRRWNILYKDWPPNNN